MKALLWMWKSVLMHYINISCIYYDRGYCLYLKWLLISVSNVIFLSTIIISPSPHQLRGSQSHICFLLKHNLQVCLVKCCSTIEKQSLFGFFKLYLLPCLWKEKELTIFDFKTIGWCLQANCSCWWGLGSYKGFEKIH